MTLRPAILVAAAFAAVMMGGAATLPSCNGPPDKTCYADHVNALGASEDAGPLRDCTVCLQTKGAPRSCCDAVGACDEDPTQQCAPSFKATHLCLADGGKSEEGRCKELLTNDLSKNLYQCMRDTCGAECSIPSCTVDADFPVFVNGSCDKCVGNGCCEAINTCYDPLNRSCRRAVECITTRCPASIGAGMTAFGALGPEERRTLRESVRAGGAPPNDACVQQCLDELTPAGTDDERKARGDAFEVYACGAEAKCGPGCTLDAGADARDD